jgi:hypothetical protein
VRRAGADMDQVIAAPGFFEESLKPEHPRLANHRKAAVGLSLMIILATEQARRLASNAHSESGWV